MFVCRLWETVVAGFSQAQHVVKYPGGSSGSSLRVPLGSTPKLLSIVYWNLKYFSRHCLGDQTFEVST